MNPMEESVTYQAIIRKGRLSGVREVLLLQGRKLFGPPDEATEADLNAIDDVRKLDELCERILDVGSWQELLQPTRRRRRNGRPRRNVQTPSVSVRSQSFPGGAIPNPMEESVTYQAIMQEGRIIEARRILLILGQQRFGPADEDLVAVLNAIDDLQKLDKLIDRTLEVGSWQELLRPIRRRSNGRRNNA